MVAGPIAGIEFQSRNQLSRAIDMNSLTLLFHRYHGSQSCLGGIDMEAGQRAAVSNSMPGLSNKPYSGTHQPVRTERDSRSECMQLGTPKSVFPQIRYIPTSSSPRLLT
jgi:hypothetical protein